LEEKEAAGSLMRAIDATTASGTLTRDLGGKASTHEFTDAVIDHLRDLR
jgi:isocitrate/isopropylmalate dehydrogenase